MQPTRATNGLASGSRQGRWVTAPKQPRDLEQELFARYQRWGDLEAREELVVRFMPLVRRLARRYGHTTEPLEDLLQVASLGLLKAIDRFDAERGTDFRAYAVPTILGELKRHFRDSGWALRVPRGMQEQFLKVNEAVERLAGAFARSPTPQEVAAELGASVEDVLAAMEAGAAHTTVALEAPLGGSDGEPVRVADSLGEVDRRFELVEDAAAVEYALRGLPERERTILYLRFAKDLTQSEIGERIGLSQMHVSRLFRRALNRMRVVAGVDGAT